MSVFVILLTIVLGLIFILYKRWAKLYDYWKERGVVHRTPYPFVGNMIDNLLRKKTMGEIFKEIAEQYKSDRYVGLYNFVTADLLLTDVRDVSMVLVKEFSHFMDRGPKLDGSNFTDKHLMLLTGAEWKGVRSKVSPVFSSGKLKGMLPLMIESFEYTSKYLDTLLEKNKSVDLKDIIDMYLASVSASTIYGMDPARLADPDSDFKKILDKTTKITFTGFLSLMITVFFPKISKIFKMLKISTLQTEVESYFIGLVLDTFKERAESGVVRDDVIQQLLQLKQTGKIEVSQWVKEDEEELGTEPSSITETIEITDQILVSQGFIFLMAGYDPLKSTLAMLLIELCRNKESLDKARDEINSCIAKHGGLSWQAMKDMQYLDNCLSETLRLHPAAEMNMRYCVKQFTFPDGPTVEPGTRVIIPTLMFQSDPTYFPEPDKFKPERFKTPPPPWVFMPFGLGPRMCIARRFALQEMKLFAAMIIKEYDINLDSKTEIPVRTDKWFFLRRNESDIYLEFKKNKIERHC